MVQGFVAIMVTVTVGRGCRAQGLRLKPHTHNPENVIDHGSSKREGIGDCDDDHDDTTNYYKNILNKQNTVMMLPVVLCAVTAMTIKRNAVGVSAATRRNKRRNPQSCLPWTSSPLTLTLPSLSWE